MSGYYFRAISNWDDFQTSHQRAEKTRGDAILSGTLQDRFSFVAFGPYGPVYIQFPWTLSRSDYTAAHSSGRADHLGLSANGWPVQRITKGRYRVMEPDGCVEVVSDHPCAP